MLPADRLPANASTRHRRWRWLVAFGVLRVTLFVALWLVLVGGFAWLGGSEAGLRWACARLAQASDGQLQLDGVGGRLLGDWHVRALRWRDAEQAVDVDALRVSWSPLSLARGELRLTRVEAAGVRVAFAAQGSAAKLPDDLGLPFAAQIEQLRVGRLWVGRMRSDQLPATTRVAEPPDELAWFVAEALEARLSSDGATHRVESLHTRVGRIDVAAQATLGAQAPFVLSGEARLHGASAGQDYALALDVSGTLAQLRVDGRASLAEVPGTSRQNHATVSAHAAGQLHATLEPFAPTAVASIAALRVRLEGVDPQLFAAAAPRARLDVDLALERAAAPATLSGHLRLHNRDAGGVDGGRLPIQSLDGKISWPGEGVRLDDLAVAPTGGGRLAGHGRIDVARARLEADLVAQRIDAHALHAGLPSTRLSGPAHLFVGRDGQGVDVDWRDARYAVRIDARADAQAIDLAQLQVGVLGAGSGARIMAHGRLALAGERRFAAQGRLRDVDVARLLAAVPVGSVAGFKAGSVLNADFEARGVLQPSLDLALRLSLDGSRLGAWSVSGGGDIDWSAGALRRAELDVQAAGNRLRATGALGRSGDALKVTLDAPRLAALGWSGLAGELSASLDVARGSASTDPDLAVKVEATRLRVGEWFDGARLSLDARLAAGTQGALAVDLRCSACSVPAYASAPLTLSVAADGVRAQHRVRLAAALPQQREVRVRADGELSGRLFAAAQDAGRRIGQGNAPGWRGTLAELRFSGADSRVLAELAAPVPLSLAADLVSFGPASLSGRLGRVTIDRLAYDAGLWQSGGRLLQLRPHDLLVEFPSLQAWRETLGDASVQPLVLAGDWDVRSVRDMKNSGPIPPVVPVGRLAVWRESGDLALGGVALGLAQARGLVSFGEGRLEASASLRGARAGVIGAEISCAYPVSGSPVQIDRDSPWQGRVKADIPDLAWLGALFGEGWQVAGQAHGEMSLAGSAAHPEISGQLRGERLALRALDLGMRLERGEAALDVTPQRLRLTRLRFESDLAPLPRALRLDDRVDVARLSATPGVVEASGELSLAGSARADGAARLAVRFDRYGIVQRADQWVAVSGEGELRLGERLLEIDGKLRADAAFWALAAVDRPALSDDVVLRSKDAGRSANRVGRALKVDLALALGNSAYFRGAGVDSRLAGALRIVSDDAGLPRATGSIRTVDGRFDAYGQQLDIERGIVNFQGPIDNPGLNLLAVRKNLPVEAGVEVSGTAQHPLIRLVSSPSVPDAEKLSWLVLGRSPEQQGGDGALLLAAAQTIVGGQDGGVLRQLQRALGIDEFGVTTGQVGGYSTLPTSRVASVNGFGASQSVTGQVVSVGKRLSSNALLSYQQSLNTTESIVKLTVKLSRQFSVVGSAGSDSALDVFWTHSFGK